MPAHPVLLHSRKRPRVAYLQGNSRARFKSWVNALYMRWLPTSDDSRLRCRVSCPCFARPRWAHSTLLVCWRELRPSHPARATCVTPMQRTRNAFQPRAQHTKISAASSLRYSYARISRTLRRKEEGVMVVRERRKNMLQKGVRPATLDMFLRRKGMWGTFLLGKEGVCHSWCFAC